MILQLLAELSSADITPRTMTEKPPEDGKLVGVAGEAIQKLEAMKCRMVDLVDAKNAETLSNLLNLTKADLLQRKKETARDLNRAELINRILWQEIREEFSIENGENIHLCEGWAVYTTPQQPCIVEIFLGTIEETDCDDPNCPFCDKTYAESAQQPEPEPATTTENT